MVRRAKAKLKDACGIFEIIVKILLTYCTCAYSMSGGNNKK
jgi:hypothetical protein